MMVLPPSSMMLPAWHIGPVPPPHSSVQRVFLPSLLNPAVWRPWKLLVSVSADSRTGFSGLEMSTMMAWLEQAAASRWKAGYAVTSWQFRGVRAVLAAGQLRLRPRTLLPRHVEVDDLGIRRARDECVRV